MKECPLRTCVACRGIRPKVELLRLVRGEGGHLMVDTDGVAPGRGAYACPNSKCLQGALRTGRLAHALRGAVRLPRESIGEFVERWQRR